MVTFVRADIIERNFNPRCVIAMPSKHHSHMIITECAVQVFIVIGLRVNEHFISLTVTLNTFNKN